MQDGAAAHISYCARNYLETASTQQWPNRSPILKVVLESIDFFLWGHLKNVCFSCGHCRDTAAAHSKWLYRGPQ
jgi:hypothetical protein